MNPNDLLSPQRALYQVQHRGYQLDQSRSSGGSLRRHASTLVRIELAQRSAECHGTARAGSGRLCNNSLLGSNAAILTGRCPLSEHIEQLSCQAAFVCLRGTRRCNLHHCGFEQRNGLAQGANEAGFVSILSGVRTLPQGSKCRRGCSPQRREGDRTPCAPPAPSQRGPDREWQPELRQQNSRVAATSRTSQRIRGVRA